MTHTTIGKDYGMSTPLTNNIRITFFQDQSTDLWGYEISVTVKNENWTLLPTDEYGYVGGNVEIIDLPATYASYRDAFNAGMRLYNLLNDK